jgi:methionyl-tRNA formyltransferase
MKFPKRIGLFLNGEIGLHLLSTAIGDKTSEVKVVILNSKEKQRDIDEIIDLCVAKRIEIFEFEETSGDELVAELTKYNLDFGFSCYFGHKLQSEILNLFSGYVLNMHISLLPLNRGAHPVAWAIRDSTPHGITIHKIDTGLDTGEIVYQEKIEYAFTDTAETLYRSTTLIAKEIITKHWENFFTKKMKSTKQSGKVSRHSLIDFGTLSELDLSHTGTLLEHLNQLRARNFGKQDGAIVSLNGKKYSISLLITEKDL